MALPEKPQNEFNAATGDDMEGTKTVEYIVKALNWICKMFDPATTHESGNPGGIHKGNLATSSGIITEDNIASQSVANVTANINGHAIADILEEDGVTAKKSTTMNGVRVQAYLSADYVHNDILGIRFNAKFVDPKNVYNTSTYRCTPGIGTYYVDVQIYKNTSGVIWLRRNGNFLRTSESGIATIASSKYLHVIRGLIEITNDTDYIDVFIYDPGSHTVFLGSNFTLIRIA